MAISLVYLAFGICMLVMHQTRASLLGRAMNLDQDTMLGEDINNYRDDQETNIDKRRLSRLLEEEKQNVEAPEAGHNLAIKMVNPEDDDEVRETIEKLDGQRSKVDISVGNKLIEEHLRDCEKGQEIIVMSKDDANERQRSCYLHKMDEKLYNFVCLGIGEKPHQTYSIGAELKNKEFLSRDGPESVCRDIPMFLVSNVDDIDLYKDESPLERELKENELKMRKRCKFECKVVCSGWSCRNVCSLRC